MITPQPLWRVTVRLTDPSRMMWKRVKGVSTLVPHEFMMPFTALEAVSAATAKRKALAVLHKFYPSGKLKMRTTSVLRDRKAESRRTT